MTRASTDREGRERFYERFALDFDAAMNRYDLARRLEIVGELLADLPAQQRSAPLVLDGGSGTGWFSRLAHDRGFRVTALDLGTSLLAEVRRKSPVRVVAGSVLALPFRDATFDIVISCEVIEHTADPAAAVAEYARVLQAGGYLLLTCPNRAWRWSVRLAGRLGLRRYAGFENWPRWKELRRFAEQAGLVVERQFGFHAVPFQLPGAPWVLRGIDRCMRRAGPLMINQGLVARRHSAPGSR